MERIFMYFFGLLFCVTLTSSQTSDVYKEANPDQTYIQDNSDYATLWRQHLQARNSGNIQLFKQLQNQLKQNFPEKFTGSDNLNNMPFAVSETHFQPPFTGDWGAGDYVVDNAPAYTPPANNTQAGLDLEVDSLGNKYIAYISQNRDSLRIMKSTDQGVTWAYILTVNPGGTTKWHSFDFFIADSVNTFKLGFAASRTSNASLQDGELFWIVCDANGGGFAARQILATPPNSGHVNPTIVADSYYWTYGLTYWYVAFQFVNSGTGAGTGLRAALTNDGGLTWVQDTVRNTFNDFNLDIDYRHGAFDSIYVVFTNDLTVTNANLRLNRISLGNWGTATAWTQFNVQATADPEVDPEIAVNRQSNEMACIWNQTTAGIKKVNYNFTPLAGAYWANLGSIANYTFDSDRGRIECNESQGAYRISYVTKGTSSDSVIYTSAFALPPTSRTIVTANINPATTTSPDVSGFYTGPASYGGGVCFVGAGQNRIFYDGSNVNPLVGINGNGTDLPNSFSLSQNYPNPFNPSTKINFAIPKTAFVSIKVYNVIGQAVDELVSKELIAGNYEVNFNASGLTSGIYFYTISAGDFTETKKMVLVK
ncbi:MAG: T9SS type A sorting domain-containing protein [Ignavibacteria bacterium]